MKRARSLLDSQPGGSIVGKTRTNGDILRYNTHTGEFAVGTADGTIKTLFRPAPSKHGYKTNLEYFNAQ